MKKCIHEYIKITFTKYIKTHKKCLKCGKTKQIGSISI